MKLLFWRKRKHKNRRKGKVGHDVPQDGDGDQRASADVASDSPRRSSASRFSSAIRRMLGFQEHVAPFEGHAPTDTADAASSKKTPHKVSNDAASQFPSPKLQIENVVPFGSQDEFDDILSAGPRAGPYDNSGVTSLGSLRSMDSRQLPSAHAPAPAPLMQAPPLIAYYPTQYVQQQPPPQQPQRRQQKVRRPLVPFPALPSLYQQQVPAAAAPRAPIAKHQYYHSAPELYQPPVPVPMPMYDMRPMERLGRFHSDPAMQPYEYAEHYPSHVHSRMPSQAPSRRPSQVQAPSRPADLDYYWDAPHAEPAPQSADNSEALRLALALEASVYDRKMPSELERANEHALQEALRASLQDFR